MFKKLFATGALALFTLTSTAFAAGAADVTPPTRAVAPAIVAPGSISPAEAEALQFMREEEKLAHDVYTALYDQWGLRIFTRIAASEQKHTEAVAYLLDRYDISDPAAGNGPGEFTNDELQVLYDQLVAQGSLSAVDALRVGAAIEEIDILDLQERLSDATNAEVERVFQNLLAGSESHLQAFAANLKAQTGETYEPQHMSQVAYDAIVSASSSQGAGNAWGGGNARRGGNRP